MTGLTAALETALAEQARQDEDIPGYGVGVKPVGRDDVFVQWTRDEDGALEAVEVRPPDDAPSAVMHELTRRGFSLADEAPLAGLNIWVHETPSALADGTTHDQLVAVLADLVRLIGVTPDAGFEAYP